MSVNNNVLVLRFNTDTKLKFLSPNREEIETILYSSLTYYFEVLPHPDEKYCHLKCWNTQSICRDVPRSWFKIEVKEIY